METQEIMRHTTEKNCKRNNWEDKSMRKRGWGESWREIDILENVENLYNFEDNNTMHEGF